MRSISKSLLSGYTLSLEEMGTLQTESAFAKMLRDCEVPNEVGMAARDYSLLQLSDKATEFIQSNGKLLMGFQQRDDKIEFGFKKFHSGSSVKMREEEDNRRHTLGSWIKSSGKLLHVLLLPTDKPSLSYSVFQHIFISISSKDYFCLCRHFRINSIMAR